MKNSSLLDKSKSFALEIIKVCNMVKQTKKETVLTNQLIRSGTFVGAGISEAALGFVNCTSNVKSFQADKTIVLTCTLQRTDGSSPWEAYKTKTETFSGKGLFTISKTCFTPATYDGYRVRTTLIVKNSAGTVVETASRASGVIYKY